MVCFSFLLVAPPLFEMLHISLTVFIFIVTFTHALVVDLSTEHGAPPRGSRSVDYSTDECVVGHLSPITGGTKESTEQSNHNIPSKKRERVGNNGNDKYCKPYSSQNIRTRLF